MVGALTRPSAGTSLSRLRRFPILVGLAAVGAVLFVPFLGAGAPSRLSIGGAMVFIILATGIAAVATWFGLKWSDDAGLPMPLLRAFETGTAPPRADKLAFVALGSGAVVGALGIVALRLAQVPTAPGSFLVRVASALFAAVTLESVLHLAIMSGVVRATGRVGVGIAASTLVYILFHLSTLGGQPMSVVALASIGNGIAGLVFGWLYARHGYESMVLGHLVAHAIAVGFA